VTKAMFASIGGRPSWLGFNGSWGTITIGGQKYAVLYTFLL